MSGRRWRKCGPELRLSSLETSLASGQKHRGLEELISWCGGGSSLPYLVTRRAICLPKYGREKVILLITYYGIRNVIRQSVYVKSAPVFIFNIVLIMLYSISSGSKEFATKQLNTVSENSQHVWSCNVSTSSLLGLLTESRIKHSACVLALKSTADLISGCFNGFKMLVNTNMFDRPVKYIRCCVF